MFIGRDEPNTMFKYVAHILDHALHEGKNEHLSEKDAKFASGIMLFPATAAMRFAGGELVAKAPESLLAYGLRRIRKGFAEVAMIAVIMSSPTFIILLWKYGVFETIWHGRLSLLAKFF
jgi:hypothetical protein